MSEWKFPLEGHMDKASKIYFQTMTKKDVEERLIKNDIMLIPLGSTENHGDGGPFGEDTFIVTRLAELLAQKTGCTVSEPVWFGSHPFHHIGQPGTVPIPDNVYSDYLRAIISGYWNTGFRKQIFISLHGQEYIVPSAIQEWGKKYQVPALIIFVDVPRVMGQALMDKEHGGPFTNPFQHACEAEQSLSLALFPEFCQPENSTDTEVKGFLPKGHIDRGGDIYGNPIPGHCQVGAGGIECVVYPEGVLGKPSMADPQKARSAIIKFLDYGLKLHDDIIKRFPPGVLPEVELMTQRDPEDVRKILKGSTRGGKHLYTIAWPS